MSYPGYAFPSACVCIRVCVATGNNRRFWIRDDILLYDGRLCGLVVCPPFSANSPRLGRRKSFLAEDEEIRAGTQEMSFSLLFQFIKAIRKRVQFSFFRNIHIHAYIIFLHVNELISILDTSAKSSWNFSTLGQILIALTTAQLSSGDDNQGDVRAEFVKLISARRNDNDAKYASHYHR